MCNVTRFHQLLLLILTISTSSVFATIDAAFVAHVVSRKTINGRVGRRVVMPCFPAISSSVRWIYQTNEKSKEDEIVFNNLVLNGHNKHFELPWILSGNYSLVVKSATLNNSGIYTCWEDNGQGDQHRLYLIVNGVADKRRHTNLPTTMMVPWSTSFAIATDSRALNENHDESTIKISLVVVVAICVTTAVILFACQALIIAFACLYQATKSRMRQLSQQSEQVSDTAAPATNGTVAVDTSVLGTDSNARPTVDSPTSGSSTVNTSCTCGHIQCELAALARARFMHDYRSNSAVGLAVCLDSEFAPMLRQKMSATASTNNTLQRNTSDRRRPTTPADSCIDTRSFITGSSAGYYCTDAPRHIDANEITVYQS